MAEVHVLPGIERRDLLGALPAEQLFTKAIENGVTDAVIVGRTRDGSPYVASCLSDADKAVGQLMRAVNMITSAEMNNAEPMITEDGPVGG